MKNSPSPESEASAPVSWLPVGQRVRARRIQLGFRKGAVAARLGVSMERFEAMEAGRVEITPELLGRLSELMKVPVLYFFEDLLSARGGLAAKAAIAASSATRSAWRAWSGPSADWTARSSNICSCSRRRWLRTRRGQGPVVTKDFGECRR